MKSYIFSSYGCNHHVHCPEGKHFLKGSSSLGANWIASDLHIKRFGMNRDVLVSSYWTVLRESRVCCLAGCVRLSTTSGQKMHNSFLSELDLILLKRDSISFKQALFISDQHI